MPTRTRIDLVSIVIVGVAAGACGGSGGGANPGPSPGPSPTPVRQLTYQADPTPSTGPAISIQQTTRFLQPGRLNLVLRAHDLDDVVAITCRLRWDGQVAGVVHGDSGEFMYQGLAPTALTTSEANGGPGVFTLNLRRPSDQPGSTGSGDVFVIHLGPGPGGSSATRIEYLEVSILRRGETTPFAVQQLSGTLRLE